MRDCELLKQCPFFKDEKGEMPSTARYLKMRYCTGGDYYTCARYMVFRKIGQERVPSDLFPNQLDRLGEILDFM